MELVSQWPNGEDVEWLCYLKKLLKNKTLNSVIEFKNDRDEVRLRINKGKNR